MNDRRADRIWASIHAVARVDGETLSVRHACIACARMVDAAGAGLSMTRGPGLREPVFATGPVSQDLEELQFTLGEGPCMEAATEDEPVLVADLAAADSRRRWPMFAPAAAERGIRGMFAIPVLVGAARLAVFDLYWRAAGPLSLENMADALVYADAVLVLALDGRVGVAPDLENFGNDALVEWRAEVHQATGMVSVQLGVDVTEALIRLRAYAYLHDRRLTDVSAEVVARRLRFRPDNGHRGEPGVETSPPDDPRDNEGSEAVPPRPPSDIDRERES